MLWCMQSCMYAGKYITKPWRAGVSLIHLHIPREILAFENSKMTYLFTEVIIKGNGLYCCEKMF